MSAQDSIEMSNLMETPIQGFHNAVSWTYISDSLAGSNSATAYFDTLPLINKLTSK
jgi:hypothetical protein